MRLIFASRLGLQAQDCLETRVAALGGFGLLSWHAKQQRLPSALVVGHALLAVAGFLTLLVAEFALLT